MCETVNSIVLFHNDFPLAVSSPNNVYISSGVTIRGLVEGINMEKSSQGCYKAMQIGFCDSHYTAPGAHFTNMV